MVKAMAIIVAIVFLVMVSWLLHRQSVEAQTPRCAITGAAALTITDSNVSAVYRTSRSAAVPNLALTWSGPGVGGADRSSESTNVLVSDVTFDAPGTWTLACLNGTTQEATLTVTVTSAPVRVPGTPGDSVVLTRSGGGGQLPLCNSTTLTLSVVATPVSVQDTLDVAIQEEDGSGNVIGIINHLTYKTHTNTNTKRFTITGDVADCSAGPRFFRGVMQMEQVGGRDTELVTVDWGGKVTLSAFNPSATLKGHIRIRTAFEPLSWPGAVVELQSRAVGDPQGQWKVARQSKSYTATERAIIESMLVTQSKAGAYQYRWKLSHGDVTVYSNVILLYWATPLPTPTPFVVRDEEAERQNIILLVDEGRYTRDAPDVVTYRAEAGTGNCAAMIGIEFLPVRHAQHYEVHLADTQQVLVDQSGPAGYVSFCQATGAGSGELVLTGYIDNQGPAYEIEVDDQAVVVPADSTVYSAPATLQLSWDISAAGNQFLGPGVGTDPDTPEQEPLEGVEDLAKVIAGILGASPQRVDVLLPILCMVAAAAAAAGVVWPLGWSPPAAAAGLIVFVLIWTVAGPAWFGVPLGLALALTLVMLVGGGTVVYQRVWG